MANYYPDDLDEESVDAEDDLCLFARLFSDIHVIEWFFKHAPDLQSSLQESSTWEQLLYAMQDESIGLQHCATHNKTKIDNAYNKTFQNWPLIASQCFGHCVSPISSNRQPVLGQFSDTLQAHARNPAAQCYYLRKANRQKAFDRSLSLETVLASAVREFAHMLLPTSGVTPAMSLKGLQLMFINQMQDDTEFYLAAQKVFDGTFEMPAQPNYFENTPALDGTLFA